MKNLVSQNSSAIWREDSIRLPWYKAKVSLDLRPQVPLFAARAKSQLKQTIT